MTVWPRLIQVGFLARKFVGESSNTSLNDYAINECAAHLQTTRSCFATFLIVARVVDTNASRTTIASCGEEARVRGASTPLTR